MATGKRGALSPQEARRVYNRIGRIQDWQRFYEAAPVKDLIANGDFESAQRIFEFGCGTGALARELFEMRLGPDATYLAVDVSDTMIRLATERLSPWIKRGTVEQVDGTFPLPGEDGSFDRFVSAYVFDLLDADYAQQVLDEAERLLAPGGRLCTVSLSKGSTVVGKAVSRSWEWAWSKAPRLVGGCRPVSLEPALGERWRILHHSIIRAWGVPSEVVVATPLAAPNQPS